MQNYRSRIYRKYASGFQSSNSVFDIEKASRWGKAYDYYFRDWLPKDKNASIIDLACGGGKLLYYFKERGYSHLSGVDISPEQINLAKQIVPEVVQDNILDFLKDYPDKFDLITGLDIIEHFHKEEVLDFLDLCYKSLRNGGRLILQTPNADSPWGTTHRYNDFTHEVCFNPNAILRLLQLCNFHNTEVREQGPVTKGYSLSSTIRYGIWQNS